MNPILIDKKSKQNSAFQQTTLVSWLLLIIRGLEQEQVDVSSLLAEIDLDYDQLINTATDRIGVVKLQSLCCRAMAVAKDDQFIFNMVKLFKPQHIQGLGFALYASHTMADFLSCLVKYHPLMTDSLAVTLQEEQHHCAVCFHPQNAFSQYVPEFDIALIVLHKMISDVSLGEVTPYKIELIRSVPANTQRYARYFNGRIEYGRPVLKYWLCNEALSKPLLFGCSKLAKTNEQVAQQAMEKMYAPNFVNRVLYEFQGFEVACDINQATIAAELCLSERTLRRKLQEQGWTFRGLLDQYKQQKSLEYLKRDNLTLNDIAFRLGFSDQSNFSRAFLRWFSCTPTDYIKRRQHNVHSKNNKNTED
ncbi:AraC family transcriptional regulator [Flocculibacter collagenilyticus]|uniref:AraC family transcriptional regulator n=1 Tax=Flocculibacter collagenilyticus TaxID=2744479 RepID=UPI0018F428D8|nr:AraC family transcriptional regulator [Flocculibacter collagenilyticus]